MDLKKIIRKVNENDLGAKDLMVCIIGFRVISVDGARENVRKIKNGVIGLVEGFKDREGLPPGDLHWFHRFEKDLDQGFLDKVGDSLSDLLSDELKEKEKFVSIMEKHCMKSFANPFRSIFYSMPLEDTYKDFIGRGMPRCTWVFYQDNTPDYDNFFIAAMIGLWLLREGKSRPSFLFLKVLFFNNGCDKNDLIIYDL